MDTILLVSGDFADTLPAASDCGFDSGAVRVELEVAELDGIELWIGLGGGLGSGALCIIGALTGAETLGSECEALGADGGDGGEKFGIGLGAGLGEGALGVDPVS